MENLDLLAVKEITPTEIESNVNNISFEEKVSIAESSFEKLYGDVEGVVYAVSFGKDSALMLNVGLTVAARMKKQGYDVPRILIIHGNTLLENPVIDVYSKSEICKVESFIERHDLNAEVIVASPGMSQNHLVNLIGGRTIASLPGNDAKCSVDMKVTPITRAKKEAFKSFGKKAKIVSCIGTRFEESDSRFRAMTKRGENAIDPVSINGELVLSPIAHFTLDDVWMYIAEVTNGKRDSYSDFHELMEVYREAEQGECAVIAYMDGKPRNAGCGARFGCHMCLRASDDTSMENLLKNETAAYMRDLNKFRQWLKDTHFNPSNRNWLARSVDEDGMVTISPNAYSPQHCEEMLKIALTIQANEYERASLAGEYPRFTLLRDEDILAIDVLWSRYGYQSGLNACKIYKEIMLEGDRYPVPSIDPKNIYTELPPYNAVKVPFADSEFYSPWNGLRDLMTIVADCESTVSKSGVSYADVNVDRFMNIDPDAAADFFDFPEIGVDYALDKMMDVDYVPVAGFWHLARLGLFSISNGQHSEFNRMLQMGNQITRHGVRGILNDPAKLQKALIERFGSIRLCGKRSLAFEQDDLFAA